MQCKPSNLPRLTLSPFSFQAVQEFVELCPALSESEARALLPFWPRIYSRVALDQDRRVREAAQKAHLEGEFRKKRAIAITPSCSDRRK